MIDINRTTELTGEVVEAIDDMFMYHKWDTIQEGNGIRVREVLIDAIRVIIANVPPCPDRTVAIRKLREARMDCNSAITHKGKY